MSTYRDIADRRREQIATSYFDGMRTWSDLSPKEQQDVLNRDIKWRHAETQALAWAKDPNLSSQDFFEAAQTGPDLLASTTAGAAGPGYTGVGMDPKFMAQRRLLEDEEDVYKRMGIFGMTPRGWGQ